MAQSPGGVGPGPKKVRQAEYEETSRRRRGSVEEAWMTGKIHLDLKDGPHPPDAIALENLQKSHCLLSGESATWPRTAQARHAWYKAWYKMSLMHNQPHDHPHDQPHDHPTDHSRAFGDPFELEALPLPRPAGGYGVQYLGKDQLLDQITGQFLPIRHPRLQGLFPSFAAAHEAARSWLKMQPDAATAPPLAIVPASFDPVSERHILIYGVLQPQLQAFEEATYLPLRQALPPNPAIKPEMGSHRRPRTPASA